MGSLMAARENHSVVMIHRFIYIHVMPQRDSYSFPKGYILPVQACWQLLLQMWPLGCTSRLHFCIPLDHMHE